MVNGSIEFESQAQGSVFTDYCLLCWTQAQEVSHQLVRAESDNNEDSGLAVEKLLSSINQTDTFTQSQSIYFIRFQVFATCQDWKITHQDSSINHTTAVMIVKGREETGFLKIVYHLPIKKWGDHTWGLVTTQSSLISWTQGDGGNKKQEIPWAEDNLYPVCPSDPWPGSDQKMLRCQHRKRGKNNSRYQL